ncbi:energy transducer TonB [Zoogloea sp.]|uniref:energy transducer TonB n=1 Tax=Zoogloea sp. TaxID=49181 RepID=UPI00321FB7DE
MNLALDMPGTAGIDLPAPFLVRHANDGSAGNTLRTAAGVAFAALLHAGLLAIIVHGMSKNSPPIIPPQPLMSVSLVTPDAVKPAPAPHPEPVRTPEKKLRPDPKLKASPSPQTRPSTPAVVTSAASSSPAETTAPATPPTPNTSPSPVAERQAVVATTAPRFDAAYLSNPVPEYPRLSRRMGEEGRVMLRVLVGADGKPMEVSIAKSSGYTRLDDVARETVLRSWRFIPARQGDQAVAGTVRVPIDFSLNS